MMSYSFIYIPVIHEEILKRILLIQINNITNKLRGNSREIPNYSDYSWEYAWVSFSPTNSKVFWWDGIWS